MCETKGGDGGTTRLTDEPLPDTGGRHHDAMMIAFVQHNSVLNYEEIQEKERKWEEGKGNDYEYGVLSKKHSPHPKILRYGRA